MCAILRAACDSPCPYTNGMVTSRKQNKHPFLIDAVKTGIRGHCPGARPGQRIRRIAAPAARCRDSSILTVELFILIAR